MNVVSTTSTSKENAGVHPPTIRQIFKKSLWIIFWKHMTVDHDNRRWELFTCKGQSIENLFRKCRLVLSCVYDPHELEDPHSLFNLLMDQCKRHFRVTFFRRQTIGY